MNNIIDDIIKYEQGELSPEDTIELFQKLVNNSMAWTLQGHYGRTAQHLINNGYISNVDSNTIKLLDNGAVCLKNRKRSCTLKNI